MVQKKGTDKEVSLSNLVQSRDEAKKMLQNRIDKGKELKNNLSYDKKSFDEISNDQKKWTDFNSELLARLFDNSYFSDEYNLAGKFIGWGGTNSLSEDIVNIKDKIGKKILCLESILERIDLIPELNQSPTRPLSLEDQSIPLTNDIFIVHGQDEGSKETLARFLSILDLNPIILHEQPNGGKTIIEKFESVTSSIGFAVVLMTPDDIGYMKDNSDQAKPRARQNVIFELGYFIGKLSRKNVCALYKEGVEIPSDYQGVLFIPMDAGGIWKLQLAKELKSAGLDIDMNKL